LCDLDYADDMALIETSKMGMQLMTDEVEKISRRVGLRMNAGKCKIMVSNNWEDSTVITAEGTNVEVIEDFCYLGSYLSRTANCDKECIRIGKAASVFERLINIWKSKNISLAVKIRLYESLVIATLLYGAESWPLSVTQMKQESPADAVKPARRKSMQKLLQFDVFRFISPNSISPNFKV